MIKIKIVNFDYKLTLTLISVGFLGVRFEVEEVKLPRLKRVRIMLETLNVALRYAPICSFREYTF